MLHLSLMLYIHIVYLRKHQVCGMKVQLKLLRRYVGRLAIRTMQRSPTWLRPNQPDNCGPLAGQGLIGQSRCRVGSGRERRCLAEVKTHQCLFCLPMWHHSWSGHVARSHVILTLRHYGKDKDTQLPIWSVYPRGTTLGPATWYGHMPMNSLVLRHRRHELLWPSI